VCVAGVAVREEWAGLLLPGGSRRKERCYESVCLLVGVVGGVKYLSIKVTYGFVDENGRCAVSSVRIPLVCARGVPSGGLVWNLGVNDTCFTGGWDGTECWFGAGGCGLWV
jgi:hypothetical protein